MPQALRPHEPSQPRVPPPVRPLHPQPPVSISGGRFSLCRFCCADTLTISVLFLFLAVVVQFDCVNMSGLGLPGGLVRQAQFQVCLYGRGGVTPCLCLVPAPSSLVLLPCSVVCPQRAKQPSPPHVSICCSHLGWSQTTVD